MNEQIASSSLDTVFEILSDRSRRSVLVALQNHDSPTALDIGDVDAIDREIMLRHYHLPKLEEAEYIEWDRERNAVRTGPRFDEIRPLLNLLSDHTEALPDDWS